MGAVALFMGLCSAAITVSLHSRDELFSGFPIPIACGTDVHGIGISSGLRGGWSAGVGVVLVTEGWITEIGIYGDSSFNKL